jgi:hypothetical protein
VKILVVPTHVLEDCCRQSRTTWSKSLGPSTLNCLDIWGKETIMLWQTHIAIRTLNKNFTWSSPIPG